MKCLDDEKDEHNEKRSRGEVEERRSNNSIKIESRLQVIKLFTSI